MGSAEVAISYTFCTVVTETEKLMTAEYMTAEKVT